VVADTEGLVIGYVLRHIVVICHVVQLDSGITANRARFGYFGEVVFPKVLPLLGRQVTAVSFPPHTDQPPALAGGIAAIKFTTRLRR